MANICNNNFYFTCSKNGQEFLDKFSQLFLDLFYGEFDIYDQTDDRLCIEGWFESNWSFPYEQFEDILSDYGDEEDPNECYFRCLSEEYGFNYVGMNIYQDGNWKTEQTFDLYL